MNFSLARNFLVIFALHAVAAKQLRSTKSNDEAIDLLSFSDLLNQERKDFTTASSLPTDGYCWLHAGGKFCFQGSNFQSVTKNHDELTYQAFIDGTSYSYSLPNTDKLRGDIKSMISSTGNAKLDHALSDEAWLDSLESVKFGCQVEENNGMSFHSDDKEVLARNGDGSSIWRLQNWIVNADSNGIPINVAVPNGDGHDIMASITGVEPITDDFDVCDPESDDGRDAPEVSEEAHVRFLRVLDAHDESISEEEYFAQDGKRRLDWISDLQGWVSNTQWCGAGTNIKNTPCPDRSLDFDFNADQACRRHDHGAKYEKTWIALPRLECFVDKDLVDLGGHNIPIQAAFGDFGAYMAIGCYNMESYNCFYWEGWSLNYGYCGRKWEVNYGPWRYDNAVKHAGYKARPQTCPYDTWMRW